MSRDVNEDACGLLNNWHANDTHLINNDTKGHCCLTIVTKMSERLIAFAEHHVLVSLCRIALWWCLPE